MRPIENFSRDVHAFWATTYQLDLKLFDQFLLRRLGNAPLNGVVLCDEDGVSDALLTLSDVDVHVASSANRRYLLRGIRLPSGGRFHPKTYLFASRRRTVLLVGSGNLTRSGLDRGRETFVEFDAASEADGPAFRAWGAWIRELVSHQDDPTLRRRFEHLAASVPAVIGPFVESPFATNALEPVLDLIERRAPARVTEIHVCAPYFDEHAAALRQVIERFAPQRVHVYLGARTKVDGASLRAVLENSGCAVHVHNFQPSEFVHAKLIGLVAEHGGGLLVCGSANLSQAALTRTYSAPGSRGNCEAVVLREGDAAEIRAAFVPPGQAVVDWTLSDVEGLEYEDDPPAGPNWSVRLLTALLATDGRLQLHVVGEISGLSLTWGDHAAAVPLTAAGTTVEPIEDDDALIVWLADDAGAPRSNPVVVDDPRALEAVLGDAETQRDRPAELRDQDGASELLKLLTWAHGRFIFDLEETPAFQRVSAAQDRQQHVDDTGFWERYTREELVSDPRSQTYRRIGSTAALTEIDALLHEIQAMLAAAPADRRLRLVSTRGLDDTTTDDQQQGTQWTFSARERVRSRNLLRRWARALADPRHAWLSPDAPSRNYEALLEVLALIWLSDALEVADIVDLLEELWTSLLGSDSRSGVIDRADPALATDVLASLSEDCRQIGAALAYCAVHGDLAWSTWIYAWQPFLRRGLDLGVLRPGPMATDLVEAICDERPTAEGLLSTIRERAAWVDETTWGDQLASELRVDRVRLVNNAGFRNVDTVVCVDGLAAPAADSRLIVIARRTMTFRKSSHVLMIAGDERFLIRLGDHCRARIDSGPRTSVTVIDAERLAAVERQRGTLADLLGQPAAA